MWVCTRVHDGGGGGFCGCARTCGDQKRVLDHLEMELQVAVIVRIWALGTEPLSSARDYVLLTFEPPSQAHCLSSNWRFIPCLSS